MLSGQFELYFKETTSLVKSLVFKFEEQNELINKYLEKAGLTVDANPSTWKYNMNLAGLYHSVDKQMTMVSSDTQSVITITKELLKDHPRTLTDLKLRGTVYLDLVNRYPKQAILIEGMLSTVTLEQAVAARDFEILFYDTALVASNEVTLIQKIQKWIDINVSRWWNQSFGVSDVYYGASFMGVFHHKLTTAFMNIRLEACKTNEVCQFHLWNYLSGHYDLDTYRNSLDVKQSLWLYKNIENVRRRAGTRSKLNELIENILVPAGLTLDKLDFVQLEDTLMSNLTRKPMYSFSNLDSTAVDLSSGNLYDTEEAFTLLVDKAVYNKDELGTDVITAEEKGASNLSNRLPTKVLKANESGVILSQTAANSSLKINYWGYLAHLNLYKGDFTIPIPSIGNYMASPLEAFILFIYATNRTIGKTLVTVPPIGIKSVLPAVLPTKAELQSLVSTGDIPDETIDHYIANELPLTSITTLGGFESFITKVLEGDILNGLKEEEFKDPTCRSMVRNLSAAYSLDVNVDLVPEGTKYIDWFASKSLNLSILSDADWTVLMEAIVTIVTGYSAKSTDLGLRQSDMVEIVDALTSYNISILPGNGSRRRLDMDHPTLLIYDMHTSSGLTDTLSYGLGVLPDSVGNMSGTTVGDVNYGLDVESESTTAPELEIPLGEVIESTHVGTQDAFINTMNAAVQSFVITDL